MRSNIGGPRTGARRGRARAVAVLLVAPLLVLTACQDGSGSREDRGGPVAPAGKGHAAPATVAITPADGAKDVEPDGTLTVRATGGKVTQVTVTDPKGGRIDGATSPDGATWTPARPLSPDTRYTVAAKAANADGAEVTSQSTFTTLKAEDRFTADFSVEPGSTVGVGTIISLRFSDPIKDKAAVERRLSVTAQPAVEGSWSWLKDESGQDRVDWRPREYWAPGTKVTLTAGLDGARAGKGLYGKQNKVIDFTIGRSSIAVADLKTKRMTITQDGQRIHDLPISAGSPENPTWGGTMVVMDKVDGIRMNSETVGLGDAYDIANVRYAVHLTTSGTYAHAAPWNEGKFGVVNASHGCVGMSTRNAGIFFNQVIPGDPVEVVNSTDKKVAAGNGFGGWNVDWEQWKRGSALAGGGASPAPSAS